MRGLWLFGEDYSGEAKDPAGVNYVLGVVAERHGIEVETLRNLIE